MTSALWPLTVSVKFSPVTPINKLHLAVSSRKSAISHLEKKKSIFVAFIKLSEKVRNGVPLVVAILLP